MKVKEFKQLIREVLLKESNKILTPRRSPEERKKNHLIAIQKQIQQYIKDGSKGDLNLSDTIITTLPNNLTKVGGNLSLEDTKITSLPNNLQVEGYLNLNSTEIISLPDNLKVGGYLDLENTPITSLPNNLKIGENLFLDNTKITSLPNNLQVGGDLYLFNTPLAEKYTKEEIRKMTPGIKGRIIM